MKEMYELEILKREVLNDEIFKLSLSRPDLMVDIRPGQFFNLSVTENGFPLLKRPISVSFVEQDRIELTIKKVGQGTQLLFDKKVGDTIEVLGPLGNGFFLDDITKNSLIVGGGIGVSPVKELARYMVDVKNIKLPILLGFRDEPFDMEDFNNLSDDIAVSTESGIAGYQGYVTSLLEERLKKQDIDQVLVCGPSHMLRAVQSLCDTYHVTTQLLMEERMACGIGACLVCICAINDENGMSNKRVCKDGPVFYGSEVVFNV